jgi:hypothetical protein
MKKYIQKDMVKKFTDTAKPALARIAGTAGAAYVSNTILPNVKFIPPAGRAAVVTLLGIVGEMYAKDEMTKAAAQGVSAYGGLQLAGQILKDKKSQLGLAGLENLGQVGRVDWQPLLAESESVGYIEGVDDYAQIGAYEDEVSGIDGTEDQMQGIEDEMQGTITEELGSLEEYLG